MTPNDSRLRKTVVRKEDGETRLGTSTRDRAPDIPREISHIPVRRIRPEEGLSRKRDQSGHRELCDSIRKFGVLTPITVRFDPEGSGDFLLVKGQGRTLACRILGLETVPAVIVDDQFDETQKVQQFLVENVARLRMRPVDRALLIAHARRNGEETAEVAARFGVTASTVRRLEAQLSGASSGEIAALRSGEITLSLHSVIARNVAVEERDLIVKAVRQSSIRANEMEALFVALDWSTLSGLGVDFRTARLELFQWCCETLATLDRGPTRQRFEHMAALLPESFSEAEPMSRTS